MVTFHANVTILCFKIIYFNTSFTFFRFKNIKVIIIKFGKNIIKVFLHKYSEKLKDKLTEFQINNKLNQI
jgi:hypothetical protein